MSLSVSCPSCSRSLYLPDLEMMPGGEGTVVCTKCYCKYNLVAGDVAQHDYEVIQVSKPGSSSTKTIEFKRNRLRLLRSGHTLPELFEFDRPSSAPPFQLVAEDRLLLIFLAQRNQLLQIHNLSTDLKLKIKSPLYDALSSAQILAFALCFVFTGYLWVNKITSLKIALVGSTVLSMGFGYGIYRHLKPQEKDLSVRQQLGAVQDFLKAQHRVELGLEATRNIQKADQTLIDQLLAMKQRMVLEPDLYGGRLHDCDRSIAIMEQKTALLDKQESGFMRVLNMLKVDAMTSQIADQLPDAIDADILNHTAQVEAISKQIEALAQQITSAQSLQLEA